jgi:phosphatidylserine decarboxylase
VRPLALKLRRPRRARPLREDLNFLLTNRIPRRYATLLMGRLSQVRSPRLVRFSVATWGLFARDLRLHEARRRDFATLRDCFTRELKPGARPIDQDPDVLASPCDAIVGAHGRIRGTKVFQAKGFPYDLSELLCDPALVERHRDGQFVTLRLKASMYHRFHAPCDGRIDRVRYISGDTWNVNPIALSRVEKLFCKNERAVLDLAFDDPAEAVTLVPVAAILVASIKLRFLEQELDLRYKGRNEIPCAASFAKGDELGYFQNGSTIVVFVSGPFALCAGVTEGATIRVGRPLFRRLGRLARVETERRTE